MLEHIVKRPTLDLWPVDLFAIRFNIRKQIITELGWSLRNPCETKKNEGFRGTSGLLSFQWSVSNPRGGEDVMNARKYKVKILKSCKVAEVSRRDISVNDTDSKFTHTYLDPSGPIFD